MGSTDARWPAGHYKARARGKLPGIQAPVKATHLPDTSQLAWVCRSASLAPTDLVDLWIGYEGPLPVLWLVPVPVDIKTGAPSFGIDRCLFV